MNVAFLSPTADVEIGTANPDLENKTPWLLGAIEIWTRTAGRMTNRFPGIKGVAPAPPHNAVANSPGGGAERYQKCTLDDLPSAKAGRKRTDALRHRLLGRAWEIASENM